MIIVIESIYVENSLLTIERRYVEMVGRMTNVHERS